MYSFSSFSNQAQGGCCLQEMEINTDRSKSKVYSPPPISLSTLAKKEPKSLVITESITSFHYSLGKWWPYKFPEHRWSVFQATLTLISSLSVSISVCPSVYLYFLSISLHLFLFLPLSLPPSFLSCLPECLCTSPGSLGGGSPTGSFRPLELWQWKSILFNWTWLASTRKIIYLHRRL